MRLTGKKLRETKSGIFMEGTTTDDARGVNYGNSGRVLRWVAVKSGPPGGYHEDWTIYCGLEGDDPENIALEGDKVLCLRDVRKLISCDKEALEMYRGDFGMAVFMGKM